MNTEDDVQEAIVTTIGRAASALTATALTESEVKTLLFWERPDDVAMLRRVADGLHAINTGPPKES